MSKREFLEKLKAALMTRVSAQAVADNINYYEDYINTQVRMGKSEKEVVQTLGDPWILAKSIGDAAERQGSSERKEEYYQNSSNQEYYGNGQCGDGQYGKEYAGGQYNQQRPGAKLFKFPLWAIPLIILGIVFLIIVSLFSLLTYLWPILLPVLLIVSLVRMARRAS